MKIPHASILAAATLSLALCACDSGDKKDTSSAPPQIKKPAKPDGAAATPAPAANPQPPEPTGTPKDMSAASTTPLPPDVSEGMSTDNQLQLLNLAVGKYGQKQSQKMMMSAKGGRPISGSGGGGGLTSLEQLVTEGLIKKIPDAPAGKKYVLDVKTQKVRLENK